MAAVRIVDLVDLPSFELLPPCADPGFMHASCDYWEDADRGSKAARASWLGGASAARGPEPGGPGAGRGGSTNPFAPGRAAASANPFAPSRPGPTDNPFATSGSGTGAAGSNPFAPQGDALADNPFAPRRVAAPAPVGDGPRKLQLLTRGLAVFGSYAKVLLEEDVPAAFAQFGPLSAYPRALRTRELYPRLPAAPLPAVITCIATTAEARARGHARRLVRAVCEDLAGRGFAAVEAYPTVGAAADETSAADPAFWEACGFAVAAPDERYPVLRRELT